jgi:hypothetical protein
MLIKKRLIMCLFVQILLNVPETKSFEVVFAINGGGDNHTDVNGIHYEKDRTDGKKFNYYKPGGTGKAGDTYYNVPKGDEIIYKTVLFSNELNFGFNIPVMSDGKYWLLMKFMERDFGNASKRIFNVTLNGHHTILSKLDIFAQAGLYTALEKFIFFGVCNQTLRFEGENSTIIDQKIQIGFLSNDQPIILSSVALLKGDIMDISKISMKNTTIILDFIKQESQFQCHESVNTQCPFDNSTIVLFLILSLLFICQLMAGLLFV